MEAWLANILEEMEDRRRRFAHWGAVHEWISYIGLTLSSVCSAIAALSIASNESKDHPFIFGFFALIPAIWLGIERGLKPRTLSTYNYEMENKLRIMILKIKNLGTVDSQQIIPAYALFLEDEQKGFAAFMQSFDQPVIIPPPRTI